VKFATNAPVKIVLLGAGGTGGYIAPHLYRMAFTKGGMARIILVDGDIVEEKNLIRQNFAECDIGENKARVLAERYSRTFGLKTEYVSGFIESAERLAELLSPETSTEQVILIGAVDNNSSRRMCHDAFYSSPDLIYIDSGNGEFTGQIVCGIRRKGRTYFKPVGKVYPDILENTDKFPTELSCAERSVSAPQSIAANLMAATCVASMLYGFLMTGNLTVRSLTFSSKSINVKSHL
jgi:hypothetical protein